MGGYGRAELFSPSNHFSLCPASQHQGHTFTWPVGQEAAASRDWGPAWSPRATSLAGSLASRQNAPLKTPQEKELSSNYHPGEKPGGVDLEQDRVVVVRSPWSPSLCWDMFLSCPQGMEGNDQKISRPRSHHRVARILWASQTSPLTHLGTVVAGTHSQPLYPPQALLPV